MELEELLVLTERRRSKRLLGSKLTFSALEPTELEAHPQAPRNTVWLSASCLVMATTQGLLHVLWRP